MKNKIKQEQHGSSPVKSEAKFTPSSSPAKGIASFFKPEMKKEESHTSRMVPIKRELFTHVIDDDDDDATHVIKDEDEDEVRSSPNKKRKVPEEIVPDLDDDDDDCIILTPPPPKVAKASE
jgi:hypothetical protein